jgi:hypothetical protein
VCFHQLLQQLHVRLPHIISCRLFRIPRWEIVCPTCDLRLVSHPRGATSLTYLWCFTQLPSSYLYHMAVYTDRSFLHELTGSAFVYDSAAFSYRLYNFNSIFTAELCALYRALLFFRRQPWQCHLICTDSLSALQSLSISSRDHPIVKEIVVNCPTSRRQGSLLCSAGYLAILVCPTMRLLMLQLK